MGIFKGFDWVLFTPMVLLITFGAAVLFSTSAETAKDQLIFAAIGLILYLYLTFIDFRVVRPFSPYIYFINFLLLLITLGFGIYSKGAIRWIPLGVQGFTLQPSEFMKLSLILALSAFFCSRYRNDGIKSYLISILILAVPLALIFIQPDLGTSVVMGFIWLVLVVSVRSKFSYLVLTLIFLFVVAPLSALFLKPYQRDRLSVFLSPKSDPLGSGYHVIQSEIAVGSGRFFGRGFGRGTQSHLRFLPEYHTDFIFATLSEEWGFIGSILVLILYGVILFRILSVGYSSGFLFGQLLSLGVFSMIFIQVSVNIGMNLGLSPITGIPLPLLSSGGSSTVLTMLSLGLVQSVARKRKEV